MSDPKPVYVGNSETVAHSDRDCASGGPKSEMTPQEARDGGYSACLDCLSEGWPDDSYFK